MTSTEELLASSATSPPPLRVQGYDYDNVLPNPSCFLISSTEGTSARDNSLRCTVYAVARLPNVSTPSIQIDIRSWQRKVPRISIRARQNNTPDKKIEVKKFRRQIKIKGLERQLRNAHRPFYLKAFQHACLACFREKILFSLWQMRHLRNSTYLHRRSSC